MENPIRVANAGPPDALSRLAGGIAQDFNNLLTVIHGNAALLQERLGQDSVAQSELAEIQRATDRASEVTRQLMVFSRRQVVQASHIDLSKTVEEMELLFGRLVGDDVTLTTDLEPETWTRADPNQIEQAVLNLVVNAREAIDQVGAVKITTRNVALKERVSHGNGVVIPAGDYVMVRVEDNGSGIEASALPHVFEPFFTTKPVGTGTGLGLAAVYGIVRQAGGYVWIESQAGTGSTATLYFPRSTGASSAESPRAREGRSDEALTILVVEDEQPVRALAARILERSGYTVLQAANGNAAIQVIEDHSGEIALVLCDVVMPGITGSDLALQLKARTEAAIVFMSGYTEDEMVRQGLLAADINFVEKPFSPAQLTDAVAHALEEHSNGRNA